MDLTPGEDLNQEPESIEPATFTIVYDPEVGALAELTTADGRRFYGFDAAKDTHGHQSGGE